MKVGFLTDRQTPGYGIRCLSLLANSYDVEFFYFTPERVNVERKIIRGLFFDKATDGFTEKETRYPDVIDDQHSFRGAYPKLFQALLPTCLFMFPPLGGKQKVYNILKNIGYEKYLIETHKCRDIELDAILNKHASVILKPIHSNQGRNIYRLRKENDVYHLRFGHEEERLTRSELELRYGPKFIDSYLVQNCIDSSTRQGNPFDIRIYRRRGKNGKWSVTRMFARIGAIHGLVSNLEQGGSIGYFVDNFLSLEFGGEAEKIKQELLEIAKTLPDAFQAGYSYVIDALGFDVGIDKNNNNELKLFEVNSDPALYPPDYEAYEARFHHYMYLYDNLEKLLANQQKVFGRPA